MKRLFVSVTMMILLSLAVTPQEVLTNDSVIKMIKAGLGESTIVTMINTQPGKSSLGVSDVISLKGAGVSENIIGAMLKKSGSTGSDPQSLNTEVLPGQVSTGPVNEVGVYFSKGRTWQELQPEGVNWKTGGVLKHVGTAGVVKGDVNGHINGAHSRNELKVPLKFAIYVPEGISITEYQLIRLRGQKGAREFRTVTGGVFHVSCGATRDNHGI
jgi:hypothetical protein